MVWLEAGKTAFNWLQSSAHLFFGLQIGLDVHVGGVQAFVAKPAGAEAGVTERTAGVRGRRAGGLSDPPRRCIKSRQKRSCGSSSTTGPNRHPGYEAILMISGEVALYVDDEPSPAQIISHSGGHLCHFRSAEMHRIVNTGSCRAEFLVIRFHRDGDGVQT